MTSREVEISNQAGNLFVLNFSLIPPSSAMIPHAFTYHPVNSVDLTPYLLIDPRVCV